mmetsp:Transcript_6805/g.22585  ORF Transcript_6805/g.22585 Transcript_6805/m.22585 type:complete len:270 (+) Transcript_6805:257-1066(+)
MGAGRGAIGGCAKTSSAASAASRIELHAPPPPPAKVSEGSAYRPGKLTSSDVTCLVAASPPLGKPRSPLPPAPADRPRTAAAAAPSPSPWSPRSLGDDAAEAYSGEFPRARSVAREESVRRSAGGGAWSSRGWCRSSSSLTIAPGSEIERRALSTCLCPRCVTLPSEWWSACFADGSSAAPTVRTDPLVLAILPPPNRMPPGPRPRSSIPIAGPPRPPMKLLSWSRGVEPAYRQPAPACGALPRRFFIIPAGGSRSHESNSSGCISSSS